MIGARAQTEKEGERRCEEGRGTENRGGGRKRARWIGEGRRQPARRMPLLAATRFWDRLGSVESGQPSGRRHSSSRYSRSAFFRSLTSRSSRLRRVSLFIFYFLPSYSCFLGPIVPIASVIACFHPPITPTPRRARARTRTRCVAREIAPRSVSPSERRIAIA